MTNHSCELSDKFIEICFQQIKELMGLIKARQMLIRYTDKNDCENINMLRYAIGRLKAVSGQNKGCQFFVHKEREILLKVAYSTPFLILI